MKIKVCGMREEENIKELLKLQPDLIGFIFYDKSKRYVSGDLPDINYGNTRKTGVFVNENMDNLLNIAKKYKLDNIQLHGLETPEYCQAIQSAGYTVIKAFSVYDTFDFNQCLDYEENVDCYLFDTKGKLPGGNGQTFNWEVLSKYHLRTPFLLSGGIALEHLSEVKKFSHPQFYGIDVNSGFEIRPAYKDINQLKTFFYELRS